MNNLVIHVGLQKTGTKWLQGRFFPRSDLGFAFLESPEFRSLAWDIVYEHGLEYCPEAQRRRFEALAQAHGFAADGGKVPIFSWERLSGSSHSGGYDTDRIAERLQLTFPRAKVLLVVREQRSHILSTYKQYVRAGGTVDIDRYLEARRDVSFPTFSWSYYAYDRLAERYRELFGAANVLVLPYEMMVKDITDFVSRIMRFAGLESNRPVEDPERVNVALKGLTISIKRRLNPFIHDEILNGYGSLRIPGMWRLDARLFRFTDRIIPARWHRRVDLARRRIIDARVAQRFADSNRRLSALIGIDLGALGYEVGAG